VTAPGGSTLLPADYSDYYGGAIRFALKNPNALTYQLQVKIEVVGKGAIAYTSPLRRPRQGMAGICRRINSTNFPGLVKSDLTQVTQPLSS